MLPLTGSVSLNTLNSTGFVFLFVKCRFLYLGLDVQITREYLTNHICWAEKSLWGGDGFSNPPQSRLPTLLLSLTLSLSKVMGL